MLRLSGQCVRMHSAVLRQLDGYYRHVCNKFSSVRTASPGMKPWGPQVGTLENCQRDADRRLTIGATARRPSVPPSEIQIGLHAIAERRGRSEEHTSELQSLRH